MIWEIWNEPNISQFWKPEPDASAYARLAIETARAVRAADPDAVILAPGSSTFPWPFLETIFAAGLLEHIDAVSVHPYRETAPETALATTAASRPDRPLRVAGAAKHADRLLRMGLLHGRRCGERGPASPVLVRQWLANLAAGVNLSIFYDWRDDGDNAKDREHRFGTVRRMLEPKPSFLAAQKLIRTLHGYTVRHRLEGSSPSAWKLLFEQAEEPGGLMLVEWSADLKSGDARQTPSFHPVAPGASDARPLRRLANVRFAPGPLAENQGFSAVLPVTVVNTEDQPATVHLVATALDHSRPTLWNLTLQPGERANRPLNFPPPACGSNTERFSCGSPGTTSFFPPWRPWTSGEPTRWGSPRHPGPKDSTSPWKTPGAGNSRASSWCGPTDGRRAARRCTFARGRSTPRFLLPQLTKPHQVVLADESGSPAAQTTASWFEAMTGFPAGPEPTTEMESILFVDNAPQPPRPLTLSAAGADARRPRPRGGLPLRSGLARSRGRAAPGHEDPRGCQRSHRLGSGKPVRRCSAVSISRCDRPDVPG